MFTWGHLMELLLRVSHSGYRTGQVLVPDLTFMSCYGPGRGAGSLELDRGSNPSSATCCHRDQLPTSSSASLSLAICRVEETELP